MMRAEGCRLKNQMSHTARGRQHLRAGVVRHGLGRLARHFFHVCRHARSDLPLYVGAEPDGAGKRQTEGGIHRDRAKAGERAVKLAVGPSRVSTQWFSKGLMVHLV